MNFMGNVMSAFARRSVSHTGLVELASMEDITPNVVSSRCPEGYNPSWLEIDNTTYFSIRASSTDTVFLAFDAAVFTDPSRLTGLKDERILSSFRAKDSMVPVKDLKFFDAFGSAWFTFNTGHPPSRLRNNDIFLAPVSSIDSSPYLAVYERRKRVEKNWGFFEHGERLYAIYSIDPFHLLAADSIDNVKREIHFSEVKLPQPRYSPGVGFSPNVRVAIASQPFRDGGKIFLFVHEKAYFLGKFRLYLPRLVTLVEKGGLIFPEDFGPRLTHNVSSLTEASDKNPFAFGVTYVSGIQVIDGEILLGYGLADRGYRIVRGDLSVFQ